MSGKQTVLSMSGKQTVLSMSEKQIVLSMFGASCVLRKQLYSSIVLNAKGNLYNFHKINLNDTAERKLNTAI